MRKKNLIGLMLCIVLPFSLIGCNIKDDYIIETKESTDEKPSGDKVNEVFESEKMKDLMDKLKTTPKEVSDKLDEADSDTVRTMKKLNDKVNELTDALNNADIEGKSEEVRDKVDDISDNLEEIKDLAKDAKDRADTIENPIDKTQITDTVDELTTHIDNLERALDRAASTN